MNISKTFSLLAGCAILSSSAFFAMQAKAGQGNLVGEPDFLLILGCRVKGDEPEETLKARINAAADFLLQHKNTIAICCGGIVHSDQTKSEAQAIADGLVAAGVEKERLILEDKSTTTGENFKNAGKILRDMQLACEPKIAFLSSDFHLLRAGWIALAAGVRASSVAAPSPKETRLKNTVRELAVMPATLVECIKIKRG